MEENANTEVTVVEKQLPVVTEEVTNFDEAMGLAANLLASKWLADVYKKPEQVAAVILKGRELGFKPMTALDHINIIKGKPVLSSWGMLSLINRSGVMYQILDDYIPVDVPYKDKDGNDMVYQDRKTTFRWYKVFNGQTIQQDISYTWSEAQSMGLTNNDNWQKQPKNMLRIRALTTGARLVAPEALMGTYEVSEMNQPFIIDSEGHTQIIKS